MAKKRQTDTYSNLTEINDFIYFFSNQNNVSYCQKDKKHSKINMNLTKIVTYLESVNTSVSMGVSKLLCILRTYLCSHIPIYKIYNGEIYRYIQSETQP